MSVWLNGRFFLMTPCSKHRAENIGRVAVRMLIVQGEWSQFRPFWWVKFEIPDKGVLRFNSSRLTSTVFQLGIRKIKILEFTQNIRKSPSFLMELFYYINGFYHHWFNYNVFYLIHQNTNNYQYYDLQWRILFICFSVLIYNFFKATLGLGQ